MILPRLLLNDGMKYVKMAFALPEVHVLPIAAEESCLPTTARVKMRFQPEECFHAIALHLRSGHCEL